MFTVVSVAKRIFDCLELLAHTLVKILHTVASYGNIVHRIEYTLHPLTAGLSLVNMEKVLPLHCVAVSK